jgi:hypothetical protein
MRPVVLSITGVGTSNPYAVDTYISPSNMGLAVIVTGTITYKVQYTFDNVFAAGYSPTAGSSNWFDHPTLVGSASGNSNIAYPVTGIRLLTSAGTGTATLTIIQAGGGGNA